MIVCSNLEDVYVFICLSNMQWYQYLVFAVMSNNLQQSPSNLPQ